MNRIDIINTNLNLLCDTITSIYRKTYNVAVFGSDLKIKDKRRELVEPRQLVITFAYNLMLAEDKDIQLYFKIEQSATLTYSRNRVRNSVKTDSQYKKMYEEMQMQICTDYKENIYTIPNRK